MSVAAVAEDEAPIPVPRDEDPVGVDEMLAEGLSYRQLDYWSRAGYLQPVEALPGSGRRRRWTAEECAVARAMLRLIEVGFRVEVAARLAREHAASETVSARLGPDLLLVMLPDLWAPEDGPEHDYPIGGVIF